MKNLSQKLDQEEKKPLIEEITLTDEDQVYLNRRLNILFLIKNDYLYSIRKFSKIDPSDPKVSAMRLSKSKGSSIQKFQPYKELRSSQ